MSSFQRVKSIFLEACALPPAERSALLDRACEGDAELRAGVQRLLDEDADPHPFVECAARGAAAAALATKIDNRALPERVGRYRILGVLGAGGMGVVYEAEQEDPRRRVALKVIRPGLVSAGLLRRFQFEARVLGQLRHPGIAQIYEAGTEDDGAGGRPFFAMELVEGLPLLRYADERGLDVRDRLRLIARICDALHHAHQKGVIHRDLKPGNILVEEGTEARRSDRTKGSGSSTSPWDEAHPKILDFGVARATDADVQATTLQTDVGQIIGTIAYMSPEQAAGDPADVDIRSDVYAMGVMTFELLSGRLPCDVSGRMVHDALRVIREDEPAHLGSIDRALRGDVETIVAKALEKEPGRRYQSAAELAADIRRYLLDQPIVARPRSALYQIGKFARRHRPLVGAVLLVFAAMAVATVVSLRQAHLARLAQADAEAKGQLAAERATALEVAAWRTYRTAMASAMSAFDDGDAVESMRFLETAPEALRGWEHAHLAARLDATAAHFTAETPVRAARFDADARHVVIATERGLVQTWDPAARAIVRETALDAPLPPLPKVRGIPRNRPAAWLGGDGATLLAAVGTEDDARTVVLYDAATGRRRAEMPSEAIRDERDGTATVHAIALSPDGKRVALGGSRMAMIWTPGAPPVRIVMRRGDVTTMAFDASGERLAVAFSVPGEGHRVSVYDAGSGERLHPPYRNGIFRVDGLALTDGGATALLGSEEALARVVDVASGAARHVLEGHTGPVSAVAVDPAGRWMATGARDGMVRVWQAASGALHAVLTEPASPVEAVAFSGDGARLLAAADRAVRVYDLPIRRDALVLEGHEASLYGVRCCGAGRLASVDFGGGLRFWDAATGAALGAVQAGQRRALAVAGAPGVPHLATAHEGGAVRLWSVETAEALGELRASAHQRVNALDCSADGTRLVGRTQAGVDVWEFRTGERIAFIKAPGQAQVGAVAISPDGRLVAADVDGAARGVGVWSAETGAVVHAPVQTGAVRTLAFSPDGALLAAGSVTGAVELRDARTNVVLHVLEGHTDKVYALAFSPDGSRLASGGNDRTIMLWDVQRGDRVLVLRGHRSFVYALAFSPDGSTLYSGAGEGTIGIWSTIPASGWLHAAALAGARLSPSS